MDQTTQRLQMFLGTVNICTLRAYTTIYKKMRHFLPKCPDRCTREELLQTLLLTVLHQRSRSVTMPWYTMNRGITIINCLYVSTPINKIEVQKFALSDTLLTLDQKSWICTILRSKCPTQQISRHFSNTEAAAIHNASLDNSRNTLFVLLLLTTGLRIGAIVRLMWCQFSCLEPGFVATVPDKGQTLTRVYLHKTLSEAFKRHKALSNSSMHVFPSRKDTHLTTRRMHDIFKEICAKAGVHGVHTHPHTCRHTVAHMLLECNNSISHISKFLGHRTINSTAVYLSGSHPQLQVPWLDVFKSKDGQQRTEQLIL